MPSKMSPAQRPCERRRERIDCADRARVGAELVGQRDGPALVRNGEHEAVEVLHALQLREAAVEIGGQHVDGNHQRVEAARRELRRDHLGRAHLLDRIADDAVDARATRYEVDFVGPGRIRRRWLVASHAESFPVIVPIGRTRQVANAR
jgi:hypothetical protein